MAVRNKNTELKDEVIEPFLNEAPNAVVLWYLMAGYCYFVLGVQIVSHGLFDRMKANVIAHWGKLKTPVIKPFTLTDIKKEVGWIKLSHSLKVTAKMHANEVVGKGKAKTTTPVHQPAVSHTDWAKLRVEARIVLSYEATDKHKAQVDHLCESLGFSLYTGILYYKGYNKAETAARLMRCLQQLTEQDIPYRSYSMNEVLIDSNTEDVWSYDYFKNKKAS